MTKQDKSALKAVVDARYKTEITAPIALVTLVESYGMLFAAITRT